MRTRCIVMASGQSQRMGHNKLAIMLGDKTILEHAIMHVRSSRLSEILVIYGRYPVDTELPTVFNAAYEEGMSTSIIAGLQGFDGDALMIVLGDMPFVKPDTINRMLDCAEASSKGIVLPCVNGERGNPVLIKRKYFDLLLQNRGDKGARDIIRGNHQDIELCEVQDQGILIDIDDEVTLEKYMHRLEEFMG